jgi:signal transduction histidine kinase/DNA-binding NarL/FixJ family response regulator
MTHRPPVAPHDVDEASRLLVTPEQRAKVLSTARLKLVLISFVSVLLLGASAVSFVLVSRIFDQLTPATSRDLERKAQRGAIELAHATELGMVTRDLDQIRSGVTYYATDEDVEAIVVTDADGQLLYRHGAAEQEHAAFSGRPNDVADRAGAFVSWAEAAIEGEPVGRVAVVVSQSRLRAGEELRSRILQVGAAAGALAFLLAVLFVNLYIGPLVQMTHSAFESLERKTREAVAATRLKSEFLANMSHEIRTPMNGVVGMSQLLQGTELDPQQRRYANAIQTSAHALLALINDVLDLSKIEAGKLELHETECDVRRLVEEVAELVAPAAHAKGLEIACHFDPSVPKAIRGDWDRMRQVLSNMAGNAVKFTERGYVRLEVKAGSATAAGHTLEFIVTDTGVGIAPENQAFVFGQFSQVDGSLTRRYGGTGLGLAISKRLVELMGGTVRLESEVGKGSRFSFTVRARAGSAEPAAPPRYELPILVVMPQGQTRDALLATLDQWGAQVAIAEGVQQAVRAAEQSSANGAGFAVCFCAQNLFAPADVEILKRQENFPDIVFLRPLGTATPAAIAGSTLDLPLRERDVRSVLSRVASGRKALGSRSGRRAAEAPSRVFEGAPHVLVVEDNVINQQVMRSLLEELGVTCDVCPDGERALEALEGRAYPVVLMDCQMPVLDGYEATRRLRSWGGERSRTPILAVTAHAFEGEKDRALAAGMDGYLAKPVTLDGLVQALEPYLGAAVTREAPVSSASHPRPEPDPVGRIEPELERRPAPRATRHTEPERAAHPEPHPSLEAGFRRSPAVMRLFVQLAPEQVAVVREAVFGQDREAQKAHAHRLKGSCYAIGAKAMAQLCATLERAERDEAEALVLRLEKELGVVLAALEAEQTNAAPAPARASTG